MEYANQECKQQIDKLNISGKTCYCPVCKNNKYVVSGGTNKGMKKWVCKSSDHENKVNFSTSTSYEAIEIYRDTMTRNLCLLTHTNSCVKGITSFNETSKYFVEFAYEALYEFINTDVNHPIIQIDQEADFVTIFFDLSGSKLSKNKAIILAKVGDKIMFEIVTHSNYISTYGLLSSIKERLRISDTTQVIFVTDGEIGFVDSIKHFFPDAIHIRQFHKQSCKGIIYVHFKHIKQAYTMRCLWDEVLKNGVPSKDVIKQRELKAKKRLSEKERKKDNKYSELSKDIILWKGTVYLPRGARRLIKKESKKKSNSHKKNKPKKKNTSNHDTPELIFKGTMEEAKKMGMINECLNILKNIFGGLYITSNIVETIFNVKAKFAPHRTMKFGERILVCVLYCHLNLKYKKKKELVEFFKENVITYDLIMQKVLHGSGLQKNKRKEPSFIEIIQNAIEKGKELVIHYCDSFKKHTSRTIKPTKITFNEYDYTTKVEAFCNLRKEKRTFYLERIRDAAIYEPKHIIF